MFQDQVVGCPNKYNIYHTCSEFCLKKFGSGTEIPPTMIKRKYNRLVKKYPLPENWRRVWEPGTCRYYFWNMESDEVSWYPPGHPNFKLCLPVSKLKAQLKEEEEKLASIATEDSDEDESEESDSDENSDSDDSEVDQKRQKTQHQGSNYQNDSSRRKKVPRNDLDPMDPASYSETCPRGRWADGLEPTEGKTGTE